MEESNKSELKSEAPSSEVNSAAVKSGEIKSEVEELIDFDLFSKVKLRVAKIESAEVIPKSTKLLRLMVNLGPELGTRQILAGIGKQFSAESLVGRSVIVVANLKPAKLMGLESQGMLLAVGDAEPLSLIHPGADVPPGSVVR